MRNKTGETGEGENVFKKLLKLGFEGKQASFSWVPGNRL